MSVKIAKTWSTTPKASDWNPSAERWKKSPEEKVKLANLKLKLFQDLIAAGFDPKKRMNLSDPFRAVIW